MRRFFACLALLTGFLIFPIEHPRVSAELGSSPLTVNVKNEPEAQILVGFIVNGTGDQVKLVESAATKAGALTGRIDPPDNGGPFEVMVLFPATFDHALALGLFRRAQHREFGTSKVEAMLITQAQYQSKGLASDAINKYPVDLIED